MTKALLFYWLLVAFLACGALAFAAVVLHVVRGWRAERRERVRRAMNPLGAIVNGRMVGGKVVR